MFTETLKNSDLAHDFTLVIFPEKDLELYILHVGHCSFYQNFKLLSIIFCIYIYI
jgi:hypothetical protein